MRKTKIILFLLLLLFKLSMGASFLVMAASEGQGSDYLEDALLLEDKSDAATNEASFTLPSVGEVAFRMFFFLAIVLLMLAAFLMAARRWLAPQQTETSRQQQDVIKVLAYRRMDPKKGLYLIEVLGKVLVIGSDIEGLNLITEITDPEKIAEASGMSNLNTAPEVYKLNPFQGVLDRFSGDYQAKHAPQAARQGQARQLIKKMDELKNRLSR